MNEFFSGLAVLVAGLSVVVSISIYYVEICRKRKRDTLEAFQVLENQVFDPLSRYTFTEIEEVSDAWTEIKLRSKTFKEREIGLTTKEEEQVRKYAELTGFIARIEHFSLGVNTGIYDAKIAERGMTSFFVGTYRYKLEPLIKSKHSSPNNQKEYYVEFRKLVEKMEKIEAKKEKK